MNQEKLLELKKEIDQAKSKVSELKGRRQGVMETLKNKWGCSNVEQAKKKISKLKDKIASLEEKKEVGIKKLEEEYEL